MPIHHGNSIIKKLGGQQSRDLIKNMDLAWIPVDKITEKDCVLFMWWVGSMPREAINLCESWGFRLVTMNGITWLKMTKHWAPHFGMGTWTRQNSESCLIAVKGKIKPTSKSERQSYYDFSEKGLTIAAKRGQHSEKPKAIYDKIIRLSGDLPRIELFCRGENPSGWDSWGEQSR
jgi:N6-adenosine-specific RNA methylase IME4